MQINITWKQCADLPTSLCGANAVTINGKVYFGDKSNNVYCYDPPHNNWAILPPPPVSRSTLAQVNGELVAIGGDRKSNTRKTNDLYSYIKKSRRWKQILPPMPTARLASGVFNLQSALVVAGGCIEVLHNTDTVEVLHLDTLQWYKTCPLPSNCLGISTAIVDNRCYVLGGHNYPEHLNRAMYVSVDDLLNDTVAAKCSSGDEHESIWKIITDTPAIGGSGTSSTGGDRKEVYMYSPSTNSWIYINDLPAPLSGIAVASLSSTELLMIGGWSINGKVKSVYKGTLQLKL